jgi:hypothetical protein
MKISGKRVVLSDAKILRTRAEKSDGYYPDTLLPCTGFIHRLILEALPRGLSTQFAPHSD